MDVKIENKINLLVDNFIKKILDIDNNNHSLDDKINIINNLLDNLIDFCIKKNIFYYINNKITYSNITKNFKIHLFDYIHDLIDKDNNLINKYFKDINKNEFDNVSDINSIIFNKFKNNKNKVQFNDNNSILSLNDYNHNIEFNNVDNDNFFDEIKLSIYIKMLINQNKYLIDFTSKIINMCKTIYDSEQNYNPENPF